MNKVRCPKCGSTNIARCYDKETGEPISGNRHICLDCQSKFGVVSKTEVLELIASATLQNGFSIR